MYVGERSRFDPTSVPTSAEVKVGWGEAKMASDEAILSTEGLASCTGVMIYDPTSSAGYLAHVLPNLNSHSETLVPMVHEASTRTADTSRLLAWVRGGSVAPSHDRHRALGQALRVKTAQLLGSVGIKGEKLDIGWNDDPDRTVNMFLLCGSGAMVSFSPDST